MSSLDPLGGAAGHAIEQIVDAELKRLAADAALLRGELEVGETVAARVLPSNGLTDLLEILGKRVAASLPAELRPGDVIAAQVTGFDGDRILLQIVAGENPPQPSSAPSSAVFVAASIVTRAPDEPPVPAAPPAPSAASPASAPAPETAAPASPVSVPPAPAPATSGSPAAAAAPVPAGGVTPLPPAATGATPVVPAASRINPEPVPPPAPGAARTIVVNPPPAARTAVPPFLVRTPILEGSPDALRAAVSAARPQGVAPAALRAPLPGAPGTQPPRPAPPTTPIESRIAAARTGATAPGPDFAGRPPAEVRTPIPPPAARGFVAPPAIEPRGSAPPPPRAGVSGAPVPAAPNGAAATPAPAGPPPPRTIAEFADPAAIVRALRLPVTPTNVANARLALESPARLPAALDALDRALTGSDDPRAQSLRTIAAFVGRLDPKSPTLATQLAAYVEHVVEGGDAKLGDLAATRAAIPPAPPAPVPAPAAPTASGAPTSATPPPPQYAPGAAPPPVPLTALAQAAERQAALGHDLKSTVLALLASPPADARPGLQAVLAEVATAITAQQVSTAQSVTPQGVVLSFPVVTPEGTAHARVRVDRDAPQPAGKTLDGDDFHIAFVLETAHLGVVAIDLHTVGRSVDVAVSTETAPVARRFGDSLGDLRGRLETLHYTVASADARAVDRPGESVLVRDTPLPPTDPDALMDRRA